MREKLNKNKLTFDHFFGLKSVQVIFSPRAMRLPSPEGLLELGEGNRMGFSVSAWGYLKNTLSSILRSFTIPDASNF